MTYQWIKETEPTWDEDKQRILSELPEGVFDSEVRGSETGDSIGGEWWRVEDDGETVGYGWLDVVWGDGEVLLAVDSDRQGEGIGSFIMEHLKEEAREKGVMYIYNVVPESHPDPEGLMNWLEERGFEMTDEERHLLKANLQTDSSSE